MPVIPPRQIQEKGGSPKWMVTFGDAMTLLLVFFVMMLSFSTPNPEDFRKLKEGIGKVFGRAGPKEDGGEKSAIVELTRILLISRLDVLGAEHPEWHKLYEFAELLYYYEDLDLAKLPKLGGSKVLRVRLSVLFDENEELSPDGKAVLDNLRRVLIAEPYRLIVRVRPRGALPESRREKMAVAKATRIVQHLRSALPPTVERYLSISNDIQLVDSPLEEGHCELILLEG